MDHWVLERQWGPIDKNINFKPVISLNIIHLWGTVVKIQMRPWIWSTKKIVFTVIHYLYSVTLGRMPMEQAQPSSWIVCKGCLCSLPLGTVSLAALILSGQQTQKTGLVRESDSKWSVRCNSAKLIHRPLFGTWAELLWYIWGHT